MNRLLFVILSIFVVGSVFGSFCVGGEKTEPKNPMKQKLAYSKNILDALIKEDFEAIINNAKALNKLGEKRWQETESPDYRTQNQVFWFTTGTLLMAAEQKNMDGATLSYTQMTLSCINCHKLLRSQ